MPGLNIIFVGTAGCGKTSLTRSFGKWLEAQGYRIGYINLDPGVIHIPYNPSYDVRKIVKVLDLMREEKLGPNGAMIKASQKIEDNLDKIIGELGRLEVDMNLIDTPGQMELFVFRPIGPRFVEALASESGTVAVYIIDPELASDANGLSIGLSMSLITRLRLGVPVLTVVNKADSPRIKNVEKLMTDTSLLRESILREESGLAADLSLKFIEFSEEISKAMRLVKVSAKTGEGMDTLYDFIHEALCECGDLG